MSERLDGQGEQASPERILQPQDLRLIRALGTAPSRGLFAAILAQNPQRGFDTTDALQQFRRLMGLGEREQSPLLPNSNEFRNYEEVLRNYEICVQTPVPRRSHSYAGQGQEAEGVKLFKDIKPDVLLAVLGQIFHFIEEYPHLPLAKILTTASKNPLELDSTTKRARIITTLAHEYRKHKDRHEYFSITSEALQGITNLTSNDIHHHVKDVLVKEFNLITELSNGYRTIRRVDPNSFARKDMRDVYNAILQAESLARERGESLQERYFTDKELRQLGSPTGYGAALQELAAQGYLAFLPRSSLTVDDDQGEALEAIAAIIDGSVELSEAFLSNGMEYADRILANANIVQAILEQEQLTARGRKESQSAATQAIEEIIRSHPGVSPKVIFELFKIQVENSPTGNILQFYSQSSVRNILGKLLTEGKVRFTQAKPPTGVKRWYSADASEEVVQREIVAYTGIDAWEKIKAGKPGIILADFLEDLNGNPLPIDTVAFAYAIAGDSFEDLEQILERIVNQEIIAPGEFEKVLPRLIKFLEEFRANPNSPSKTTDIIIRDVFSFQQSIVRERQQFIVINGSSCEIIEQKGKIEVFLKREGQSSIRLGISPRIDLFMRAMQRQESQNSPAPTEGSVD